MFAGTIKKTSKYILNFSLKKNWAKKYIHAIKCLYIFKIQLAECTKCKM